MKGDKDAVWTSAPSAIDPYCINFVIFRIEFNYEDSLESILTRARRLLEQFPAVK